MFSHGARYNVHHVGAVISLSVARELNHPIPKDNQASIYVLKATRGPKA